jgi:tight adherence protein C
MPPEIMLATSGVFAAVAVVSGTAMWWWLTQRSPERQRLEAVTRPIRQTFVVESAALIDGPDPMLARLTRLIPKSPKEMSRIARTLARAGFRNPRAVVYFCLAELLIPVSLVLIIISALGLVRGLVPALALAVVGYALPALYVGRVRTKRQKAISNGLPDALDLMTVCVESGSGLDQALAKTSEELKLPHPALAEELQLITTETRAGKPRMEAFKNFALRTGVDDVRTLVSLLAQTDRFGTSIGQALRTHSETSRTMRRQAAEERAGKVGVKLVFPLALCLFPALYIVCLGPVIVKVYRAFM